MQLACPLSSSTYHSQLQNGLGSTSVSYSPHLHPSSWELLRSTWHLSSLTISLPITFSFIRFSWDLLSHGSLSEGYSLRHLSLRITSVFLPCSISDFHHTCSRTFRLLAETFLEFSYLSSIHSVGLCFKHS